MKAEPEKSAVRYSLLQLTSSSQWLEPLKSAGVLLAGKTAQGALSIVYLALAARALGVTGFGTLIILNGLVVAVSEIARFDSWQVVLRYGTPALEGGDRAQLHEVLRFTLLLDALGSVIGLAVVMGGLSLALQIFDVPAFLEQPVRLFSLSVAFLISTGGANGILRLLDRFDLIAWQTTMAPIIRVVGTIFLFVVGGGVESFLWLWLGATVIGRCLLHILAWRELHRRTLLTGFGDSWKSSLARDGSIWRFVFGTSANATLGVVDKHAGLLAVGWLIGPASAGLYRAALHLADVLIKPSRSVLIPAIYPELARLTARNDVLARGHMVWRTLMIVGAASLVVLVVLGVFGDALIAVIFGPGFEQAYGVMIFLAAAGAINSAVFPLEPLLISIGRVRVTVLSRVASVAVYVVLLFMLTTDVGLIGAGIASTVYAFMRGVLLFWFARAHLPAGRP